MKKLFVLTLIGLFIGSCSVFAYEKHYIKNSKGQTTGYTKTYSNGKTVQYNKKGASRIHLQKRFYRQNNEVF